MKPLTWWHCMVLPRHSTLCFKTCGEPLPAADGLLGSIGATGCGSIQQCSWLLFLGRSGCWALAPAGHPAGCSCGGHRWPSSMPWRSSSPCCSLEKDTEGSSARERPPQRPGINNTNEQNGICPLVTVTEGPSIWESLGDYMLAIDGAHAVWKVPPLKETHSNVTPLLLGWNWHEVIHQAVPNSMAHISHFKCQQ